MTSIGAAMRADVSAYVNGKRGLQYLELFLRSDITRRSLRFTLSYFTQASTTNL